MKITAAAKDVPQQSPSAANPTKAVHIVVQRSRSRESLLQETDLGFRRLFQKKEDLNPSSEGHLPL
jgi:hypothetical protein